MKKLLIISLLFISLFNCRTVKKEWVKETFAEKSELNYLGQNLSKMQETLKTNIKETLNVTYSEILQKINETQTTKETETITGTIDITAEDGKEKSGSIGNTKVTSNGANITVQTATNKSFTKEFEALKQITETRLDSIINALKDVTIENNSLKSEIAKITSNQKSETNTTKKETNKRGWTFGAILLLIILLVLGGGYLYLRKK